MVIVSLQFDAADQPALAGVLSRYVVASRMQDGCTNIDLSISSTVDGRFLIVEKWASAEAQRAHFDSPEMVAMAEQCAGLLRSAPVIDRWEPVSAHDLH